VPAPVASAVPPPDRARASRPVPPILLLLLAVAGAVEILALTPHGAFSSPDSVDYATAARTLLRGEGYLRFNGEVSALWPPLFSTLLACVAGLGFDLLQGARVLNAAYFGATVALAAVLLRTELDSRVGAVVTGGCLLLCWPLIWPALWTWSEPLFTLLLTLFLWLLGRFLQGGSNRQLAGLIAIAGLACLQRYAGLALVGGGAVALATLGPARGLRKALAFAALAPLPLLAWLTRNIVLTGTLAGRRPPSAATPGQAAVDVASVLASWVAATPPGPLPGLIVWGILLGVVAGLTALCWPPLRSPLTAATAVVFASNSVFVAIASVLSRLDGLDRLLAPVFVPAVLLGAVSARRLAIGLLPRRLAIGLVTALTFLWAGFHGRQSLAESSKLATSGRMGFTSHYWRESSLIALVRIRVPQSSVLLSNNPAPVSLWAGRPVGQAAQREDWDSVSADEVYLAWFGHTYFRKNYYEPGELASRWRTEHVEQLDDGTLLRLVRRR
jgi:hypothetical protein